MSRGLGVEQRAILQAAATTRKWWERTALQQQACGKLIEARTHYWVKRWWRDGKELTEGNFTRALRSLERRGLLFRRQDDPGCHPSWLITNRGVDELGLPHGNP